MKNYILSLILVIVFVFYACYENTKIDNSVIINTFDNFKIPKSKKDLNIFNETWENILNLDTTLINFLIINKDEFDGRLFFDSSSNKTINIGLYDTRIHHFRTLSEDSRSEIAIVYLITALYYENYYFASDKILYDKSNFDINNINPHFFRTSEDVLNKAWENIVLWKEKIKGKDLNEIRQLNMHPLEGTNLKWIGEVGCIINPEFERKPIFPETDFNNDL